MRKDQESFTYPAQAVETITSEIKVVNNTLLAAIPAPLIGGAEKNLVMILKQLDEFGVDTRLAMGTTSGPNTTLVARTKINLGSTRARHAAIKFIRQVKASGASSILLNLGYINLVPFIRIFYPRMKIIVRIGNTISQEMPPGRISSIICKLYYSLICACSDKVIVQSSHMRDDLLKTTFLIRSKKTYILRNPIEEDFESRSNERIANLYGNFIFCAASNKRQKRIDILLQAFNKYAISNRDVNLVIAGVSMDEIISSNSLLTSIGDGLHKVFAIGQIDNIYPLIRNSILCASTSDYEGSSNYLYEVSLFNKYCVITDCPGSNREIFSSYERAHFVRSGCPEAFYEGIKFAYPIALRNSRSNQNGLDEQHLYAIAKQREEWRNCLHQIFLPASRHTSTST